MTINAIAGLIEAWDIDEYRQITPPWEVILRQMSPGRFHARMEYVQVNGILMYREHWTRRVVATGESPAGYFMFAFPASPKTLIDWCGKTLGPQRLAYGSSSSAVDFVVPDDSEHAVLLIPTDRLVQHLGEESAAALLPGYHHINDDRGLGNRLLAMLQRLIDRFQAQSELLADVRLCNSIEAQLLEIVTQVLHQGRPDVVCQTAPKRRLALSRAIEYVEDLHRPITVPELAKAANVSQRVLELAFRETLGTTPRRYLRWNRMNQLQHDLLTATADSSSVTEISSEWGFSELGRLSVDYKQLFGESPSTTLARTRHATPKRIVDILPRSNP